MTWTAFSEIVCKSSKELQKWAWKDVIESKTIVDKKEIFNRFNEVFAKNGPKLNLDIKAYDKGGYETYLKSAFLLIFL